MLRDIKLLVRSIQLCNKVIEHLYLLLFGLKRLSRYHCLLFLKLCRHPFPYPFDHPVR